MTNQDRILKSRDIALPTKIFLVKAMVFRVVMYGCESWTRKKAEHWRIDAFELWCWRRLLRVPWTARRSNQSILKEISPEYSLDGLMLKLKLPILWPLDVKNWLLGKDPDAGKDWRQEEKGMTEDKMVGWHHWLNGHEFEQAPGVGDGQGSLAAVHGVIKSYTQLSDWTELNSKAGLDSITDSMDMNLSKLPRDSGRQRSLVCYSPWGSKEWNNLATQQQQISKYKIFKAALKRHYWSRNK